MYYFGQDPRPQYLMLISDLMDTKPFQTGEWQAMDVSGSKLHETHELTDVSLVWDQLPKDLTTVIPAIDFPWAHNHFSERVSGIPYNPAPSHLTWPYAVRDNTDHTTDAKFDHTYPERFWPRHAGPDHNAYAYSPGGGIQTVDMHGQGDVTDVCGGHSGIRFPYGDLRDLVGLLATKPLTRQGYLPVWFPEDTGATEGQRVPCTLGYHFMQRGGRLSCRYYMRSCEVYRHLSNDVYLAAALTKWICTQVREMTGGGIRFQPGSLVMHISSLHAFVGDKQRIKTRMDSL